MCLCRPTQVGEHRVSAGDVIEEERETWHPHSAISVSNLSGSPGLADNHFVP